MGFWGEERWKSARPWKIGSSHIIDEFEPQYLRDGCYRLRLGSQAVVSVGPTDQAEPFRQMADGATLTLEPGQFAHLITAEAVHLPSNALGLINIATAEKIRGLVNISGFHVDAGYSGHLIFTVFNAGATSLTLRQGERLFRLWLMDFDGDPSENQKSFADIPKEWANNLKGAYPSAFALATHVRDLEVAVNELKAERRRQLIVAAVFAALFVLLVLPFLVATYANLMSTYIIESVIPSIKKIVDAWQSTIG